MPILYSICINVLTHLNPQALYATVLSVGYIKLLKKILPFLIYQYSKMIFNQNVIFYFEN